MAWRRLDICRVRRFAWTLSPSSTLALATEAGVSDRLLRMIRDGERSATPAVVEAVAGAMERLGARHGDVARVLRQALSSEGVDE